MRSELELSQTIPNTSLDIKATEKEREKKKSKRLEKWLH